MTKESFEDCMKYYRVFIIHLDEPNLDPIDLNISNRRQTMIQFLYRKRKQPDNDRFLVFIHETCELFDIKNYFLIRLKITFYNTKN